MANEVKKPNDIFVATLKAPQASVLDLYQNSLTPDNTSFLSPEEYKNTPLVQKIFTKDDVFDEQSFTQAYLLAAQKYQDLTNKKAVDELEKQLEYSSASRYKPLGANIKSNDSKYENLVNPLGYSYGINGINKKGDPLYTEEENAQSNRIFDPKNNKWLDETPESMSFFKKMFGETLVYAQWDENGTHVDPMTGQEVQHYKGQRKTDENGNYYTELIGDRELLDKKVVSVSDILTKEDSWINQYDFFDSDGYDKSAAGIAMKTFVHVLPYLIPGFNAYYGAFTAAVGLASVLPTVYKSLEGIFTGDQPSEISKQATKLENWFRKFDSSTSREGQGFWSLESVGNLTSDIFGQLYQQRAAASLAKFIKNADMKNKAARQFALAYMGLISGADVYNDALNGGYDRRTAGFASLATMSGLYGIMNFNESTRGLGTWFLRETTGTEEGVLRGPVAKIVRDLLPKFEKSVKDLGEGNPKTFATTLKSYRSKLRNLAEETLIEPTESMWKSAIVEGVEEVSEEVIQDMVKGVVDTMSWLGFTGSQGSFGGFQNVFSKEGFERYLATLVGGAAGGALFHLNIDHIEPFIQRMTGKSPAQTKQDYTLLQAIIAGRGEDIKKEIRRQHDIINNNLSAGAMQVNGQTVYLNAEGQSQADLVAEAALRYVEALEKFVDTDVKEALAFYNLNPDFKALTDDVKRQIISQAYTNSTVAQSKFDEYITNSFSALATELLSAKNDLNALGENASKEEKEAKKKAFEQKKKQLQGFFNGDQNINFGIEYKILEDDRIRNFLLSMDPESYAYNTYGIEDFNSLSEQEKKTVIDEWKNIQEGTSENLHDYLPKLRKLLQSLIGKTSKDIAKFANSKHKSAFIRELYNLDDYQQAITEILNNPDLSDEEKQRQAYALDRDRIPKYLSKIIKDNNLSFTLSDAFKTQFGTELIKRGIITLDGFSDQETKIVEKLLNTFAAHSGINYWSKEQIKELVSNVNAALSPDSNNLYAKKIRELRASSEKENEKKQEEHTLGVILETVGINEEKLNKDEDISFFKLSELEQYLDGVDIDEELYNLLEKLYNPIIERASKLDDFGVIKDKIDAFFLHANNGRDALAKQMIDHIQSMSDQTDLSREATISKADAALLIKALTSLVALKKKVTHKNPLVDVAKNIYSQLVGSTLGSDIFSALESAETSLRDAHRFSSFALTTDDVDRLRSALNALDAINAIAISMASSENYKSISELSREFIDLYGNNDALKEQYQVISREDAGYVQKWVAATKDKIKFLVSVSEQIVRDSRELDQIRKKNHYENLSSFYKDLIEKGTFNLTVQEREFKLIVDQSVNPDVPDNEQYCLAVEQSFYNSVQAFLEENKDIEATTFIKTLFDAIRDNKFGTDGDITDVDYDAETAVTKDQTKKPKVKSNFLARRLGELVYYSPENYLTEITEIYEKNPLSDPGFSQSLVLRSVLATINNFEEAKYVIREIGVHKDDKAFVGKTLALNTITIIGAPGSGKNHIISLLKDKIGKVKAVSKTENKVKSLEKDLGVSDGQSLEKFLGEEISAAAKVFSEGMRKASEVVAKNYDKLLSNKEAVVDGNISATHIKDDLFNIQIFAKTAAGEDYTIQVETLYYKDTGIQRITVKDFGIKSAEDFEITDSVVIDEATFLNPYVSQLIDLQASKKGAKIFLLGDQTQMGWSVRRGDTELPYNLRNIAGHNTSVLVGSYRASNEGKSGNAGILRDSLIKDNGVFGPYLSLYKESLYPENHLWNDYFKAHPLKYNITDTGEYFGDLVTFDIEEFKKHLEQLKLKNKEIAVVVPEVNENNSIYNEIKTIAGDNVTYLTLEQIQGDEYDYVVGYKLSRTPGNTNKDIDTQKVNMLITRSRDFGLYYEDPINGLMSYNSITTVKDISIRKQEYADTDVVSKNTVQQLRSILESLPKTGEPENKPELKVNLDDAEEEQPLQDEIEGPKEESPIEQTTPVVEEASTKDSEETTAKKKVGNNMSGVHPALIRIGLTTDQVEKLKKASGEAEINAIMSEVPEAEKQFDLARFWIERTAILPLYGEHASIESGKDLLDYYESFINDAYKFYEEGRFQIIAVIGKIFDSNVDYAYNKVNNEERLKSNGEEYFLRLAIKVGNGYISIGRIGYNLDSEGNVLSEQQKTLFTEMSATNTTQVREFRFRQVPDRQTTISSYLQGDRKIKDLSKLGAYSHGIVQYTGYRPYKIKEPSVITSNGILFGKFSYGRITEDQLANIGWRIIGGTNGYVYSPETYPTPEKAKSAFKEWYSQFRLADLTDDNWIDKVYKRRWAVVQYHASKISRQPILLDEISHVIQLQKTKTGRIRLFSLKQILQGLAKSKGNPQLFDELNSFRDYETINARIDELNEMFDGSNVTFNVDGEINSISGTAIKEFLAKAKHAFSVQNKTWGVEEDADVKAVISYLNYTYPDYFFKTNFNEAFDSRNVRISRIFEMPRYLIDWDQMESVTPSETLGTATITDTTEVTESQPAQEELDTVEVTQENIDDAKGFLQAQTLQIRRGSDIVEYDYTTEDEQSKHVSATMAELVNWISSLTNLEDVAGGVSIKDINAAINKLMGKYNSSRTSLRRIASEINSKCKG